MIVVLEPSRCVWVARLEVCVVEGTIGILIHGGFLESTYNCRLGKISRAFEREPSISVVIQMLFIHKVPTFVGEGLVHHSTSVEPTRQNSIHYEQVPSISIPYGTNF
jgi:hypothetical protein